MNRTILIVGPLLAWLGTATPALARDYGQQGTVWPIVEPDLLAQIHARLTRLEKTGETARLNQELKRRTIARVNRPEPVAGVDPASATRSWRFDPTITVERNIADDKGRVIIAAGTRVNPLDTVPLRAPLVFLDGDDPAQLAWATRRFAATRAKLILVRGAPLELMKARQRRFYFDQGGSLVKHFGIRAVPATVEQEGRILLVTEEAIEPQKGKAS
ncbi:MAG: type-F conjugative transfer system protein TraW [Allosphingosinicella sp.]|uniref:type-F conjugative transfer system protein TraW n=1 Tax=Allosphingosinicella sp. TaxID=2823234 RepID=UPI00393F530E